MALGLSKSSGNGDFLPVFKFSAVSGDAVISHSERQADGTWEKVEKDISFPIKLIFDFENIEVGWMHFSAKGPDFALVKLGNPLPLKPTSEHKDGFRITLYNKEIGLAAMAATSGVAKDAMDTLHNAYLAEKASHPGKVAVVEFKGTKKVSLQTKEGTKNYKSPEWSIVSWVDRPEGMRAKEQEVAHSPVATLSDDDAF